ncbi:MAG: hypothetical protein IJ684_02345 [Bacteroidales bacterium]|nr:hypothetical protein [Bacteroidales bacterium]
MTTSCTKDDYEDLILGKWKIVKCVYQWLDPETNEFQTDNGDDEVGTTVEFTADGHVIDDENDMMGYSISGDILYMDGVRTEIKKLTKKEMTLFQSRENSSVTVDLERL